MGHYDIKRYNIVAIFIILTKHLGKNLPEMSNETKSKVYEFMNISKKDTPLTQAQA